MSRSLRALFLAAALLGPAASAPALAAESSALEQAYQKEFAYLAAEKRALQERLAAHQAEARQRASAAEGRVQGLEVRLLTLERQGDALEKRLEDYDEAVTALAEARDLLDGTALQAKESLGLDLPDHLSDAQRLDSIFKAAVGNLDKASQVRVEPGAFFLPDGTRVQGEIVRLGEIAAYGVAPGGVGSLLPVGEGRMQLRLGVAKPKPRPWPRATRPIPSAPSSSRAPTSR